VHIPDAVIARIEGAKDQRAEGKRLCVEIIQQLREMPGIAGVHLMAYKQEESIAEIVHESGILRGRTPWRRDLVAKLQAVETQGAL
jgi:5,10-methylenetetrahydrofolate reductase